MGAVDGGNEMRKISSFLGMFSVLERAAGEIQLGFAFVPFNVSASRIIQGRGMLFEDMLLSSTRRDLSHEPIPSFVLEQVLGLQSVYHPTVMPMMRSHTEDLRFVKIREPYGGMAR